MGATEFAGAVWRHGTGLYHGAVLEVSEDGVPKVRTVIVAGQASAADAVSDVVAAMPELPRRHPRRLHRWFVLLADAPAGCVMTHVRGKRGGLGPDEVECRIGGTQVSTPMTGAALRELAEAGALRIDSSSGEDHGLDLRYDHYVPAIPVM